MEALATQPAVEFVYENWRGETATRRAIPNKIYYGETEWHPEPQWLLQAYDLDKEGERVFAFSDVLSWETHGDNLSHPERAATVEEAAEKVRKKIEAGPQETIAEQLELLEMAMQSEFGRYLIHRQGLNREWIEYAIRTPLQPDFDPETLPVFDQLALLEFPLILATRERYKFFQQVVESEAREGMTIGALPCGWMTTLLTAKLPDVRLVGIDIDPDAFAGASRVALEEGKEATTSFLWRDGWNLRVDEELDMMISNGLTIYEPDHERVVAFFKEIHQALKPGGVFVTSFITPPSEWQHDRIKLDGFRKQKLCFVDMIEAKFYAMRTPTQTEQQLREAGFTQVTFIPDEASLFPTVVAVK